MCIGIKLLEDLDDTDVEDVGFPYCNKVKALLQYLKGQNLEDEVIDEEHLLKFSDNNVYFDLNDDFTRYFYIYTKEERDEAIITECRQTRENLLSYYSYSDVYNLVPKDVIEREVENSLYEYMGTASFYSKISLICKYGILDKMIERGNIETNVEITRDTSLWDNEHYKIVNPNSVNQYLLTAILELKNGYYFIIDDIGINGFFKKVKNDIPLENIKTLFDSDVELLSAFSKEKVGEYYIYEY